MDKSKGEKVDIEQVLKAATPDWSKEDWIDFQKTLIAFGERVKKRAAEREKGTKKEVKKR